MNFELTNSFEKKSQKLCHKDSSIKSALTKQFKIFNQNPRNPSLKLHKLQGDRSTHFAIWIKGNLRALAIKVKDTYIFFDLITHDEY